MVERYFTVAENCEKEIIIEKSRFLAYAYNVLSLEDIGQHLKALKKLHSFATHICYAYCLGEDNGVVKFSDDGEPKGTAGLPILECIRKKHLTFVLVAVVRYFGGIKLGAGGLTRAYTAAASGVLQDGNIAEAALVESAEVFLSFEAAAKVKPLKHAIEKSREYNENVKINYYVAPVKKPYFVTELSESLQFAPQINWGSFCYINTSKT